MLKVLIADDDVNVGQCLKRLIPWDALGYRVAGVAFNGQEALDMAIQLDPDVIISDIVMPVIDGTDLCRKIKGIRSDVAFIFLSAYEDFTTAQLALRYRVEDYVLKPLDRGKLDRLAELLRSIKEDLSRSGIYRALAFDKGMESALISAIQSNDTAFFSRLFDQFERDIDRMERSLSDVKEIGMRLLNILCEYADAPKPSRPAAFEALEACQGRGEALELITRSFQTALSPAPRKQAHYQQTVDRICRYIDRNLPDESLNVSALAEAFHYSTDYLNRLFTQYARCTISKYLLDARMGAAAKLLAETDLPVGVIARRVGYGNAGYFARGFRKRYGVPPHLFRARACESEAHLR